MREEKQQSRALWLVVSVLAVVIAVSIALIGINIWEKNRGVFGQDGVTATSDTVVYNGKEYTLKDNVETMLVLGLDKTVSSDEDSYNNDKQADFIILFVIDNQKNECQAIHIDRDTMAEMNVLGVAGEKVGTVTKQIALSHSYGNGKEVSCRNTANSVSKLLYGVKIDHYVSVTMDAVPVFNDLVGGVELEILDDFSGVDDTLIKGEKVKLLGQHALNYVRSRYGLDDSTNNTRMIRQRQYIKALYEKTIDCMKSEKGFVAKASLEMTDYIVSDCSANKLETVFSKVSGYKFDNIYEIDGEFKKGEKFIEFYPDEEALNKVIIDVFYN